MMTTENGKNEFRAVRLDGAQGCETLKPPRWHRRMMEKVQRAYANTSARTRMLIGGVALGTTLLAAGCGGSGEGNYQEDVPTIPDGAQDGTTTGVCGLGYVPTSENDLALDEEDMVTGDKASVRDNELQFKVFRVGEFSWDGAIVDAEENITSFIRDPDTGEVNARVQTFENGEQATFELPGGERFVVNECITYVDSNSQRHGVFQGGFDRCMTAPSNVDGEFTRVSGNGTTQTTRYSMSQTGEIPTRDGAVCEPVVKTLLTEESTFTPKFAYGVMPYDESAVVLGRRVDLIENMYSLTIPHGTSLDHLDLPVGVRLEGAEGTAIENAGCENRGGTYVARLNVQAPGADVEVTEIADPQVLYVEVANPGGAPKEAAYVVRGVDDECRIDSESLANINRIRHELPYTLGNHPCDGGEDIPYCLPAGTTADVAIDELTNATRVRLELNRE